MQIPFAFDPEGPGARDLPWRATREPGVSWLPLHLADASGGRSTRSSEVESGGEGGDATVLIRMEPGHGYPPHRHRGVEEVLVLSGGYRDERGTWRAGEYVRYPAGSVHAPVALGDPARPAGPDNPACVLFAAARGGVALVD